jgi:hypothetical protein
MSSRPDLRLDWCSYAAAKYAVEHWHYSRSLPTPPLVKVGAWEAERFIGCVLFSRGAAQHIGRPFGLPQTAVAELTRVALTAHAAPVSRVLRVAVALLQTRAPGLELLISFADPARGHVGGIYQAANWLFLGQQEDTVEYRGPDGKRWHGRMVSPTGRKKVYGAYRAVWRPDQCEPIRCPGKLKYALPLTATMRAKLAPLAQPYLKRPCATSLASEAPTVQVGEGGATPTVALQLATIGPERADG